MNRDGRIPGQLYVQFVMGVKNAMPVDRDVFDYYVKTVKRLAPDAQWCAAGVGAGQVEVSEWAIAAAARENCREPHEYGISGRAGERRKSRSDRCPAEASPSESGHRLDRISLGGLGRDRESESRGPGDHCRGE